MDIRVDCYCQLLRENIEYDRDENEGSLDSLGCEHFKSCIFVLLLCSSILYIAFNRGQGGGGPVRRPLGSNGRALGRDRGRGRGGRTGKISAEDLDADLDNYHSEAMQVH